MSAASRPAGRGRSTSPTVGAGPSFSTSSQRAVAGHPVARGRCGPSQTSGRSPPSAALVEHAAGAVVRRGACRSSCATAAFQAPGRLPAARGVGQRVDESGRTCDAPNSAWPAARHSPARANCCRPLLDPRDRDQGPADHEPCRPRGRRTPRRDRASIRVVGRAGKSAGVSSSPCPPSARWVDRCHLHPRHAASAASCETGAGPEVSSAK